MLRVQLLSVPKVTLEARPVFSAERPCYDLYHESKDEARHVSMVFLCGITLRRCFCSPLSGVGDSLSFNERSQDAPKRPQEILRASYGQQAQSFVTNTRHEHEAHDHAVASVDVVHCFFELGWVDTRLWH